jgi:hypothetical protein
MVRDEEGIGHEGPRNRLVLGGLVGAFVIVSVVNYVASGGPVDGWLIWGVLCSAVLMLVGLAIIGIGRNLSGRVLALGDLPTWFTYLAAGLTVAYLSVAVIMVVTP